MSPFGDTLAGHVFLAWPAFTFNPRKTMNTEIMLPVPELKQALTGLYKLISRKTTLPILSCVKISRQKDGRVSLQGTDLDAHATFTLNEAQSGDAVELVVPLEQLSKACKSSLNSGQNLALQCNDKTTILRYFIGNNPVQQPVNTLPVAEWPVCPDITTEARPLQPGFGEALKQALACCSDDPTRHVLRGACLDARDPKAHYVVATNGAFLFSANSFSFPLKEEVIVPDSRFINGSGLLDQEPCFLAVQSIPVKKTPKGGQEPEVIKYVCLQNRQWQFITRQIEGQYPNWKQVMPKMDEAWTVVKLSDGAVAELLKVIPNLPGMDGEYKAVQLRIDGKSLLVAGRGKEDKDWTCVTVNDVSITGKAKVIALNRDYLLPALRFGLMELAILDELTPMICSREGKRMVIMPVRLNGPPMPKASTPESDQPQPITSVAPPAPEVKPRADERKDTMPKSTTPDASDSPFKQALQQVEAIRERLKDVLRDLAEITDTLKVAEKEKKAGDKELDQFRDKLREIQGIKL